MLSIKNGNNGNQVYTDHNFIAGIPTQLLDLSILAPGIDRHFMLPSQTLTKIERASLRTRHIHTISKILSPYFVASRNLEENK
jgi:hypothetical protein